MKTKREMGTRAQEIYPSQLQATLRTIDELAATLQELRSHLVEVYATPQARVQTGPLEQRLDAQHRTLIKELGGIYMLQALGCDRGNIPGRS